MSGDPLERPVWNSLTGPQNAIATRRGTAVRIDPAVGFFAASEDACAASTDLAALTIATGRPSWLVEAEPAKPGAGLICLRTAPLTQMVAVNPVLDADGEGMMTIGDADAGEMFALARATEPGPWESGTHRYDGYYGFRERGRLVAMAGTRLRPAEGLAEVSGVCTYPEARGKGYARRLMIRVMQDMVAQGRRRSCTAGAAMRRPSTCIASSVLPSLAS